MVQLKLLLLKNVGPLRLLPLFKLLLIAQKLVARRIVVAMNVMILMIHQMRRIISEKDFANVIAAKQSLRALRGLGVLDRLALLMKLQLLHLSLLKMLTELYQSRLVAMRTITDSRAQTLTLTSPLLKIMRTLLLALDIADAMRDLVAVIDVIVTQTLMRADLQRKMSAISKVADAVNDNIFLIKNVA